ncbi:hypothetical protein V1503_24135 [Bacillus sp. SCS-151]|uniref:hypothetical protein n=1 Tax=Nanhaiella sioensis TaxID=3115293 RepID=UPI003979A6D2
MEQPIDETRIVLRDEDLPRIEEYFNGIKVNRKRVTATDLSLAMLDMIDNEDIVSHLLEDKSLVDVFSGFFEMDKDHERDLEDDVFQVLSLLFDYIDQADDQSIITAILNTVSWHFDPIELADEAVQEIFKKLLHKVQSIENEDVLSNILGALIDKINLIEGVKDKHIKTILSQVLKRATLSKHEELIHSLFKVTAEKAKKKWIMDVLQPYIRNEKKCTSPILPKGCFLYQELMNGEKVVGIEVDKQRVNIDYHRRSFKQVGHPRLLFIFRIDGQHVCSSQVLAVKDSVLKSSTEIFRYPFSNVSNNFQACWSDVRQMEIKDISMIGSLPYLFLNSPSNDDLYSGTNLRERFLELENKDFDDEILEETPYTLGDFFELPTQDV